MANKYLDKLEMEAKAVESKVEKALAPVEEVIGFDAWFALRKAKIDAHHYKEIIMADMKARGVAMRSTIAKFDEALAKYGIKL